MRLDWLAVLVWLVAVTGTSVRGEDVPIFPVTEIQVGMRGLTHTVMQGTNIVELETEILGVAENGLGPGKDLIIGRLIDERTKVTGAVHGMSGSPLFINGRLAGALSRRLMVFEKDGHCGFTPIEDMFEVDQHLASQAPKRAPVPGAPEAESEPERTAEGERGRRAHVAMGFGEPLSLPLSVPGASPAAIAVLNRLWEGRGMVVTGGGGSSRSLDRGGAPLAPGSPVGAALALGDLNMVATGTLTWRDGNRILAFGHPMGFSQMGLPAGRLELPMCEAEIISTIPSFYMPFKMANVRRMVGTVREDRLSAIAGEIGPVPELPRYRIGVAFDGRPERIYEGIFANHAELSPAIIASLVAEALLGNDDFGEEWTIQLEGELRIPGSEPLRLSDYGSGSSVAMMDMLFGLVRRLARVYGQEFVELRPELVELRMRVSTSDAREKVESIQVLPLRPRPGDQLTVRVKLAPRHGAAVWREFAVELPPQVRAGDELIVETASGEFFARRDAGRGAGQQSEGLAELVREMNGERLPSELVVRLSDRRAGVRVGPDRLEALPPSIAAVLQGAPGHRAEPIDSVTLSERTDARKAALSGYSHTVVNVVER